MKKILLVVLIASVLANAWYIQNSSEAKAHYRSVVLNDLGFQD